MPNTLTNSFVLVNPFGEVYDYPEFVTHSNYVNTLACLSNNISMSSTITGSRVAEPRALQKKVKLISLTLDNLVEERKNISTTPEYSIICVSWLPVKSYYLIFNLMLLLEFLATEDPTILSADHKKVLDTFRDLIRKGEITFSKAEFNTIYNANRILSWRIPASANLTRVNVDLQTRQRQIVKKLYEYKREDFKRRRGIKRLAGNNLDNFKSQTQLTLFDFFYWYRIKANYRDMEFIDSGVPTNEFCDFYRDYYDLTINFYKALLPVINSLANNKLNKSLL